MKLDVNNKQTAYLGEAAETYDSLRFTSPQGLAFDKLERDQLMKAVPLLKKGASVLEVGCGTARFAIQLARIGFNVFGIDASPDMLSIAQDKAVGISNIRFKRSEGRNIEFKSNEFDFVFAIRVINSLESASYAFDTIREMIRVAKPGGLILVEFANSERPFARSNNSVRLSFEELCEVAALGGCAVVFKSGVLVLSQTVMNATPSILIPFWISIERMLASLLWRFSSRGYILLRKL